MGLPPLLQELEGHLEKALVEHPDQTLQIHASAIGIDVLVRSCYQGKDVDWNDLWFQGVEVVWDPQRCLGYSPSFIVSVKE